LAILRELLGELRSGAWVEPPLHCDHGLQIRLGAGIQLLTAAHPLVAELRTAGPELA
jgi:hypothetical protein